MKLFESESDLLKIIAEHDELIHLCVSGKISFPVFCEEYNNFYAHYALDGHESDEEEKMLLEKHANRINPHQVVAYEILGKVCADSDAILESYKQAGRFGSAEAIERLKNVQLCA